MSASHKKVVVRLLSGDLHSGHWPAHALRNGDGGEILAPDGRIIHFFIKEIKHIAYVRDFNLADPLEPERIGPRRFATKPRLPGLWVRLRFVDDDSLEGLLQDGIGLQDSLLLEGGLTIEPPDRRGNTLRLFVPRTALAGFEVLGVGRVQGTARRPAPPAVLPRQGALFGAEGQD